jgi:cytochrome oxidase assembly protein ShyY1
MTHCKTEATLNQFLALTRRRFAHGFAAIPALLLVLTLTAGAAAVWQWQRYQYHMALVQAAVDQSVTPHNLNNQALPVAGPVMVAGRWLKDSTVYVSPRMMDGRMGAWVVTVLQFDDVVGQSRHIAVHRGWLAQTQPNQVPALPALPIGSVALQGEWVAALPRAYELQSKQPAALGLWQNHSVAAHSAILKLPLLPQVMVLSPSSPDADAQLLRRVPAQQAIDNLRQKAASNQGYAVQWLGLALVGLFGLAWMWHSRLKSNESNTL